MTKLSASSAAIRQKVSYANDMMQSAAKIVRAGPGLSSALRVSVMRLARRLRREGIASIDLSPSQLAVIAILDTNGRMTAGELAAHERVQPPSMTRTISDLEAAGLVRREPNPSDGRQVLVALTDSGTGKLEHDRMRYDAWLTARLRELTPDERVLLQRAAAILERLAQS